MPGIDYDRLRQEITMEQVLRMIGFKPVKKNGSQWYGTCPFPDCLSVRRNCFSVNVEMRVFHCHHCHGKGNHLQLWAIYTKRQLHPATIELCRRLRIDIPWIRRRWRSVATPGCQDQ